MAPLVDPATACLWRACLAGDADLIQQEIASRGADPHTVDRNGETCLHMAARSGKTKALDTLLEEGLQIDQANHNGQTPLHVAVNLDLITMVKAIVENGGIDFGLTTRFSGMTALHLACRRGLEEIVQYLLDSGANCAIKDKIQKWPDFYTSNKTILRAFDQHFEACTHGRRKGQQQNQPDTVNNAVTYTSGTAIIDDEVEMERVKTDGQQHNNRDRSGPETGDIEHGDVTIFDKGAEYDTNNDGTGEGVLKRVGKKLKLNHKMDFSDNHKKRMQQNVFDRLLGPAKKK